MSVQAENFQPMLIQSDEQLDISFFSVALNEKPGGMVVAMLNQPYMLIAHR